MRKILSSTLTAILLAMAHAVAVADEAPTPSTEALESALPAPEVSEEPQVPALAEDKSIVSVLGYHDFAHKQEATEMLLPTAEFRAQLQRIKDSGIKVISLDEFLDWKHGNGTLPAHSILITIDDGWRTVYTHAYPILKEFGYPFTIYLYKDFIDTGSRSLTPKMIREMMANGATLGSHSTSHAYPSKVKAEQAKGPKLYEKFLTTELLDSKQFIEKQFKQEILTYVYPGGFHTPEMFPLADKFGYKSLFTVQPGMVRKHSPDHTLPRHIVLGTHPRSFERALEFVPISKEEKRLKQLRISTPHPVTPGPGEVIESRTPLISVDFSQLGSLDPESLVMRVGGFGKVPARYDAELKSFSWQIQRPLRSKECNVTVSWKLEGGEKYEKPLDWTFVVDRPKAYAARPDAKPVKPTRWIPTPAVEEQAVEKPEPAPKSPESEKTLEKAPAQT